VSTPRERSARRHELGHHARRRYEAPARVLGVDPALDGRAARQHVLLAHRQFSEFLLLLAAVHDGQPVARCPYAWVDHAVPLVRGWIQGMPKRLGTSG